MVRCITDILIDKSKNVEEKLNAYQRALFTYTEEYNRYKKYASEPIIQPIPVEPINPN